MDNLTVQNVSQLSLPPHSSLLTLSTFMKLARFLKREIQMYHRYQCSNNALNSLPVHVKDFLSTSLAIQPEDTEKLWLSLRELVWNDQERPLDNTDKAKFERFGKEVRNSPQHHLGPIMYYPPCFSCLKCGRILHKISRVEVVLFTIQGTKTAYSTSLRCPSCPIRFYPQYYIDKKEARRHYYSTAVPDVIQLEQHAYIETALCELMTMWMLFAWVSSQNCANIYNHGMNSSHAWTDSQFTLTSEQVWRGFVLNAMFRHSSESGAHWSMSDAKGIDHDLRLKELQCTRNEHMDRNGQSERLHACSICEKFIPSDIPNAYKGLRRLRAVVTDGVTIGRPCCKVHNCTHPLINNRSHYCQFHNNVLRDNCVVTSCTNKVRVGCRTCSIPEHVALEDYRNLKGKGFFLLQKRLQQTGSRFTGDSLSASPIDDDDEAEVELGLDRVKKAEEGNVNMKARFGRRRTHNEQLVVCTCGVIAARATMFGAEAISGVKDFMKSTYPDPKELPDVIFYDNNCSLQSHLLAGNDNYFENVILPVDVFHFKSKHSESDAFCQQHCNPAQWAELVGEDGKWVFNSSIAEQTNVWIGGYQAIVRDMLAHNYDFFLDEMIKRRNQILVAKLRRTANYPYHVPPGHLL
ncbi:hypothetical protein E1B28_001913 [Marasmius oreades]|uniref:CxC5 like cysteine cluster associated with KDZ domain-containing protein n=1 Tax=Marasmius oreades TaxID=181124 RepID=A0A9P7V4G1_9AGAR|nr:uncharacterized protein E1B28_001913 [Marasmius oreades]KAG7100133.1 hypothetical protein E1B28_001913 [Marasmius oreades]